jgi:hypothetical protein
MQGIWRPSTNEPSQGEARPYCLLAFLAYMAFGNHFVTKSVIISFLDLIYSLKRQHMQLVS